MCVAPIVALLVALGDAVPVPADQSRSIKKEIAGPITETLKGWGHGDDLAANAVDAWDQYEQHLRVSLFGFKRGKTALEQADIVDDPIMGGEHVGDVLRVSGGWFADVVWFRQMTGKKIFAGFWCRAVDVSSKYPSPQLLATFLSMENEPLEKFRARLVDRVDGVNPAFDTYLALGARAREKWERDYAFTLPLEAGSVSMKSPIAWKRASAPDLVAGWEKKGTTIAVRADVMRFAGFAEACERQRRSIERGGAKNVKGEPPAAGAFELRFTDTVDGAERWNLLQSHEVANLIFTVRVTSPTPKTPRDLELLEKEIGPSVASFKAVGAAKPR
ncbi:MAG: hypothetical protein HYR85_16900 [Planctomycetes bacterium]|nr:hypothetical protein [Planctomycetota bacterium]